MRAMTAAAIPFARSGYEVLIDFSIPPQFLGTARKIVKVCELRAGIRAEGRISNYASYRDFYTLFEDPSIQALCDDEADAGTVAKRICEGLSTGEFVLD